VVRLQRRGQRCLLAGKFAGVLGHRRRRIGGVELPHHPVDQRRGLLVGAFIKVATELLQQRGEPGEEFWMLAADEPMDLVREQLLRAIDVVGDALPCDAARLGDRLPRGRGPPTLCHRLLAADLNLTFNLLADVPWCSSW